MNSLQNRLKSLIAAPKLDKESLNALIGNETYLHSFKVYSGAEFSPELGNRLVATPHSFAPSRAAALLSSRLPKDLSRQTNWFRYFSSAVIHIQQTNLQLLTASKTTCDRFIQRRSASAGLNFLEILLPKNQTIESWITSIGSEFNPDRICISPRIDSAEPENNSIDRDNALMSLAKHLFVLKANPNSGTESRLLATLREQNHEGQIRRNHYIGAKSIFVPSDQLLVESDLYRRLAHRGANCWPRKLAPMPQEPDKKPKPTNIIGQVRKSKSEADFLMHCTRAPAGPWPNQSMDEYLDELMNLQGRSRTATDTLIRIGSQKKILACGKLNRTSKPVVSFTQSTLEQLKTMRTFRSHLARWDFEPYGIAIRKTTLVRHFSAKSVLYGNEADFERLRPENKPFFQTATTRTKSGNTIDWREEREWRVCGDVNLTKIPSNDVFFFVPSFPDASRLKHNVPYDIVVMQ